MRPDFGTRSISTLRLLENQIQILEYALATSDNADEFNLKAQIIIELGNLYNCKMLIVKNQNNEPSTFKTTSAKTYPSKINNERPKSEPHEIGKVRFLPALREQFAQPKPACKRPVHVL